VYSGGFNSVQRCMFSLRRQDIHSVLHGIIRGSNPAWVFNTHINAMTSQILNPNPVKHNPGSFRDFTTSTSYDVITITDIALEFWITEPPNTMYKAKYWTYFWGTPSRIFTNSDGTNTGVLHMIWMSFSGGNRSLWLMDIGRGNAAIVTMARYGNPRNFRMSGSSRDLESIEGFDSQYAIALAKVGSDAWIGRFSGITIGGPTDLDATHEFPIKLPISNNIQYRWNKGTTQVIIFSVNQKQVYLWDWSSGVTVGPTNIEPRTFTA
jgi:hypothetical protein